MFAGSSFNQALFSLPTSLPLDLGGMFRGTSRFYSGTSAFNQPLDLWDVSSVGTMRVSGVLNFGNPVCRAYTDSYSVLRSKCFWAQQRLINHWLHGIRLESGI